MSCCVAIRICMIHQLRVFSLKVLRNSDHGLSPFTPPQPDSLSILLKLRDKGISMLHHIRILLVLVVRSVRLDNTVDTIDRACDPVACNELGQIPETISMTTAILEK